GSGGRTGASPGPPAAGGLLKEKNTPAWLPGGPIASYHAVASLPCLASRSSELVAHRREGRVSVGAQCRDGDEADHDDEGQHHRVFNCGGAVLALHELDERGTDAIQHVYSL